MIEHEQDNPTSPPTLEYRLREMRASLEQRVERLERAHDREGPRRWIGPVLGGTALIMAIALAARSGGVVRVGSVAPSVEAARFVLKDRAGVQRAVMGLEDDGHASLTLSDRNGLARLRLAVLPDGSPGVSLLDASGETRAILGLLADGTTTLVFADGGSVARGIFALTPDGAVRVIFNDQDGRTRTAMGVDTKGQPEVSTIDVADQQTIVPSNARNEGGTSDPGGGT